ncbi:hypothetical protein [Candidatus Tisiphia endosymbiont of Oplodontha viridula]|uniref:hypothetical protein n=1 Tax=Candidatus Tisiphia endosymbiont of Oplodontha viridula TaxID=3077925 RepID=UPI0035C8B058
MYKNVSHRTLQAGYTEFLVTKIQDDDMKSVTEWVEESLINENPNVDAPRKIAFYEAEKLLISEYIERDKFDRLSTLINAIDNEKFDKECKDHPNYPKLKANECRVLAGAIIESKKYLDQDKTMHQKLGELLNTKYQTLKDIKYDVSQIKTIDTALQIVHYEEAPVSTMGATSDTIDHH